MDIVCLLIWIFQLFIGFNAYLNNEEITPVLFVCSTIICCIFFISLIFENNNKSKKDKIHKILDIFALGFWILCTIGGIVSIFANKKVDVFMFIFSVIICIFYYVKRIGCKL